MVELKRSLNVLNTAIIVFTAASLAGGAYWFIKNNLWRPKVSVINADYDKGVADISIKGKTKRLYINSTLWAGGDWGVRFGTITLPNGNQYPNRIELIRNNLVFETIAKTDVINVTS
jgi:hypothetical protein